MKSSFSILFLMTLILVSSCSSDSEEVSGSAVRDIGELIGYDGPGIVNESNMADFPLGGKCVDDEVVVLSGSIKEEVPCVNGSWEKSVDLSIYPNGKYSVTINTAEGEVSFDITKNTVSSDSEALFGFSEVDLGSDSQGAHNAVSVNNVLAEVDEEQGNVVVFNGVDSSIVLSDGTFLNNAFTQRTVALTFKTLDLVTNQVIYDEGGSVNAIGIKIENNSLILATRVGGDSGMESVSLDLTDKEGQWIKVLASFDNGELKLESANAEEQKTTYYSEIPNHSDTGGLGMSIGSDAFNSSEDFPFAGSIDNVMIYSKAFSSDERKLYFGRPLEAQVLDIEALGRVGSMNFENATDLGENASRASGIVVNVTQGTDAEGVNTAVFSGDGSIQLSDGSYFNDAFSVKTYAFYFMTTDTSVAQVLVDEGGTTNGLAISIEGESVVASVRSGGAASQMDLSVDISGRSGEWIKVIVAFKDGSFSMKVDSESVEQADVGFNSVPAHSNAGGLGRKFSGDASGFSGDRFLVGEIKKFSIYERELTELEIERY